MDQLLTEYVEPKDTKEDYHSPNWAYVQADKIGAQRTLEQIRKLIPEQFRKKA